MNTVRRAALVTTLLVSAACGSSGPVAPTATTPSPAAQAPTPLATPTFPPLSGPSRTFAFDRVLSYPVRDYTRTSRIILYDNGAFVLRYAGGDYRGGYTDTNGTIVFDWEGWSVAGPWGATGRINGDSLTVQFNMIMELSDFENAVYVLLR